MARAASGGSPARYAGGGTGSASEGTVILVGSDDDHCLRDSARCLRARGVSVLQVGVDELLGEVELSWLWERGRASGAIGRRRDRVSLSRVRGVLARHRAVRSGAPWVPSDDREYVSLELDATLAALLNSLPCPVLNRPISGREIGPLGITSETLALLAGCGFATPLTIVTTCPEQASRFVARSGGTALVRSGSAAPEERVVGATGARELAAGARPDPVCVQLVPEGRWLRVFVVGDVAIAADAAEAELQSRCIQLVRELGLEFARLRILRAGEGRPDLCYDVMSRPSYDDCDPPLRERITAAVVDRLSGVS